MAQGVFVITEQRDGAFRKVSFEAVSEGRRVADGLGADLTTVVVGSGIEGIAGELVARAVPASCADNGLLLIGALLLLFFVIALWPARVAVGWLVPGGASLAGVSGTVWDGSAARVRVGIMDVGALKWEARPLSFLTGSPTWRLEASRPDGFARATVKILGAQSVAVADLDLGTTLDAVSSWINLAGTRGNVSARVARLDPRIGGGGLAAGDAIPGAPDAGGAAGDGDAVREPQEGLIRIALRTPFPTSESLSHLILLDKVLYVDARFCVVGCHRTLEDCRCLQFGSRGYEYR